MNETARIITRTPIDQRLRALAVAHFVLAFVAGVLSAMALISALAFSTSMSGMMGGNTVDAISFLHFIGAETALAGLVLSAITAAAGWNLLTRQWHQRGLLLEVGTLALFPVGTILGVVTLVVIARPPVWKRFSAKCRTAEAG